MKQAIEREAAYREAGASGFFAPLLSDLELIETLASSIRLPLNVMAMTPTVDVAAFAQMGVSRISQGPAPYRRMIADVERYARGILAGSV